jgi:hypothetical protein
MQLFCANDLSVQQVQRNFQIITSNVNHGLVAFSGFDCNRLLPPCDYWPKKSPGSGPTSAKVLQNPAPRSCARDQLESPPVRRLRVWDASNAQKGCMMPLYVLNH